LRLVDLHTGVLELGKESPAHKVMIVLVDLPQHITYLQMRAIVVYKMLFAARYGNPAVGTLVRDMTGRLLRSSRFHRLSAFRVEGRCRLPGGLVIGMRTVGVLAYESGTLADLRAWGSGVRVEEVIGSEEHTRTLALGGIFLVLLATGGVRYWLVDGAALRFEGCGSLSACLVESSFGRGRLGCGGGEGSSGYVGGKRVS